MRTLLFAALVALASGASWESTEYSFSEYVKEFNLSVIPGTPAWSSAEKLFNQELERVRSHNAQNPQWQESINSFSHLTPSEMKAFRGKQKTSKKGRGFKSLPTDFKPLPLGELPTSVDWRDVPNAATPVKNQGSCGSCWAFASTAVLESYLGMATGQLNTLSTEQVAMCTPNPDQCGGSGGCNGATAELAYTYIKTNPLYTEADYPYTSGGGKDYPCAYPNSTAPLAAIDNYVQLPENDYSSLMTAIATVGPVAISVDASRWSAYRSGVFDGCNQLKPDVDHAVVLMGYGTDPSLGDYWLVRNSWGPTWGEKGYIRVKRTESEETRCGTDTTPLDGTACNGDTTPVTVCGTCGILYDSCYPTGAHLV